MILVTLNTRTISSPSPIWHPFLLYSRSSEEVYSAGDDIYNSSHPAGRESKGDCIYLDSRQFVHFTWLSQQLAYIWSLIFRWFAVSASGQQFVVELNIFRPSVNIFTWHSWAARVRPGLGSSGLHWRAGGELRYTGAGWASQAAPSDQPPTTLSSSTHHQHTPRAQPQWSKCQVMGILVITTQCVICPLLSLTQCNWSPWCDWGPPFHKLFSFLWIL